MTDEELEKWKFDRENWPTTVENIQQEIIELEIGIYELENQGKHWPDPMYPKLSKQKYVQIIKKQLEFYKQLLAQHELSRSLGGI